jgi:DnaJ family protein A protein 2
VEKKYIDIFIEKGMSDGQKIIQKGEGDQEVNKHH